MTTTLEDEVEVVMIHIMEALDGALPEVVGGITRPEVETPTIIKVGVEEEEGEMGVLHVTKETTAMAVAVVGAIIISQALEVMTRTELSATQTLPRTATVDPNLMSQAVKDLD
uniref:Uncharacterized protein n=1 Tax=Cacopsylla melanoneura TaxID=428564 RepID=A0A8D8W3I9_9HEMI